MKCPACHRPLRRFKIGAVTLDGCGVIPDFCRPCEGVWLDRSKMEKSATRCTRARPAPPFKRPAR